MCCVMAEIGAPISLDGVAVHLDCWCVCLCYLHFASQNRRLTNTIVLFSGETCMLVPNQPLLWWLTNISEHQLSLRHVKDCCYSGNTVSNYQERGHHCHKNMSIKWCVRNWIINKCHLTWILIIQLPVSSLHFNLFILKKFINFEKYYCFGTRYASQHIWCQSQARINWEGCARKGIQCKNGDGGSR